MPGLKIIIKMILYSLDSIAELEQKIAVWSSSHDNSALPGSFSAAARYAATVRYRKLDVYVEPQAFNEFVTDMDLEPVSSGGNAVITIPMTKHRICFIVKSMILL